MLVTMLPRTVLLSALVVGVSLAACVETKTEAGLVYLALVKLESRPNKYVNATDADLQEYPLLKRLFDQLNASAQNVDTSDVRLANDQEQEAYRIIRALRSRLIGDDWGNLDDHIVLLVYRGSFYQLGVVRAVE